MSGNEKIERFPIKITNFINPHLFQFKLENIVGQFDIDIEQKLRQNADEGASAGYNPEQGATVAAYIIPWGKWVRAEVDLILEESKTIQYVVWCMDHGVPMKLPGHHLRPMPKHLQDLPANAYSGGLARCEPIEKVLNYATMTYETHGVTDFPEYLVTNAKQLVDEAAEIFFTPRQTVGHQVFGDIHITKYCGTKIDLLHELMKSDSIKISDSVVPKGIEEMNTMKKHRYVNHLGHLNIRNVVKLDTSSRVQKSNLSAISVNTQEMDDEDKMILDWSRQNNELAKEEEHKIKKRFEQVLRTLDVYELPRTYLFRSTSTINSSSSINLLSRMSSMSTINASIDGDHQVCDVMDAPQIGDPRINRLAQKFKDASINSVFTTKPKPKKEPKTVTYIPAGFESDLVNFQKYNQFY